MFVPRRTSTIGRVLPVKVETIKATLPQESNGLVDEGGPAFIRGNYLGERLRAQVPPADSQQDLHGRFLLLQVDDFAEPIREKLVYEIYQYLTTDYKTIW